MINYNNLLLLLLTLLVLYSICHTLSVESFYQETGSLEEDLIITTEILQKLKKELDTIISLIINKRLELYDLLEKINVDTNKLKISGKYNDMKEKIIELYSEIIELVKKKISLEKKMKEIIEDEKRLRKLIFDKRQSALRQYKESKSINRDEAERGTPKIPLNGCDNPQKLSDVCYNFTNCCQVEGNACYCKHPFTEGCKKKYEECLNNTSLKLLLNNDTNLLNSLCLKNLKNCCQSFDSLSSEEDEFDIAIPNYQKKDNICLLSGKDDLKEQCQKLCQYNPNCKAYSIDKKVSNFDGGKTLAESETCQLHSKVHINDKYRLDDRVTSKYYRKL